MKSEQV